MTDIRCTASGLLLELTFVPDAGATGPGTFSARRRGPGDPTFSTPFTPTTDTGANLRSDGSGFGFDRAQEAPDRWTLALVVDGETTISIWYSADEATTWKRF